MMTHAPRVTQLHPASAHVLGKCDVLFRVWLGRQRGLQWPIPGAFEHQLFPRSGQGGRRASCLEPGRWPRRSVPMSPGDPPQRQAGCSPGSTGFLCSVWAGVVCPPSAPLLVSTDEAGPVWMCPRWGRGEAPGLAPSEVHVLRCVERSRSCHLSRGPGSTGVSATSSECPHSPSVQAGLKLLV